jgi:hypothetical protein
VNFDAGAAVKPVLRATNAGFLIITIEIDCQSREEFEENLRWTRGRDGKFDQSPFAEVDKKLCRFKDYRGYSIVFSGNKSLHFHFKFATDHLKNCEVRAAKDDLGDWGLRAALIGKAHTAYWYAVSDVFLETLHSREADGHLRWITQWRRTPWGLRRLDKYSAILDLPFGTIVPQIVIHENIRSRSVPMAVEYCISPTFSAAYSPPSSTNRKTSTASHSAAVGGHAMLEALQVHCADEWGEYPRPMSIQFKDGRWLINFKNHEADRNPSTKVLGDHRKLLICGGNNFGRDFFLPDDMSANELGNYLAYQYGSKPQGKPPSSMTSEVAQDDVSAFDKVRMNKGVLFSDVRIQQLQRQFPEPISKSAEELKGVYSNKLGQTILDFRSSFAGKPMLIKSVEGIGKTSGLIWTLVPEALDRAMASDRRFTAFAFRSRQQAEKKAEEFEERGYAAVAVKTFWNHLETVCDELDIDKIGRDDFEDHSAFAVLTELKARCKPAYDRLRAVEIRDSI